ncbi:hypothetical protein [Natrialba sp. SSL1]|uniref:hypothetical protein n=1 Tax=Natrialba sp. SSL1 TaxID=1869245 RepID=UPI0008F937FF|nr:hypothetical protein [Natrialba sp. SSL1]OIB55782.1 hypothetical protein BBD46_02940 [Natrialba sp. SSL1]
MPSQQVNRGDECPRCGREVKRIEISRLSSIAFKEGMYEMCIFDNAQLDSRYRGNTVIALHEEIPIFSGPEAAIRNRGEAGD